MRLVRSSGDILGFLSTPLGRLGFEKYIFGGEIPCNSKHFEFFRGNFGTRRLRQHHFVDINADVRRTFFHRNQDFSTLLESDLRCGIYSPSIEIFLLIKWRPSYWIYNQQSLLYRAFLVELWFQTRVCVIGAPVVTFQGNTHWQTLKHVMSIESLRGCGWWFVVRICSNDRMSASSRA